MRLRQPLNPYGEGVMPKKGWDWENKFLILRHIMSGDKYKPCSIADFARNAFDDNLGAIFRERERRWRDKQMSNPLNSDGRDDTVERIFPKLCDLFDISETQSKYERARLLIEEPTIDLVMRLTQDKRSCIPDKYLNTLRTVDSDFERKYYVIYAPTNLRQKISSSFMKEPTPSSVYYIKPESVNRWHRLITVGSYPIYSRCLQALNRLLVSDYWRKFINGDDLIDVVMLGGGSRQKTSDIVLNCVTSHDFSHGKLGVFVVDLSYLMADDDNTWVHEFALSQRNNGNDVIFNSSYLCDFTDKHEMRTFVEHKAWLRKDSARVAKTAYFILGCTIANNDEYEFLDTIKSVTSEGDILIVGLEFIDEKNYAKFKNQLLNDYNHKDTRDFVIVSSYMDYSSQGAEINVSDLRDKIDIFVDEKEQHFKSFMDGSIALIVNISDGRFSRKALVSKRYRFDNFIEYVEKFGFKFIASVDSTSYEFYKILTFERLLS